MLGWRLGVKSAVSIRDEEGRGIFFWFFKSQ